MVDLNFMIGVGTGILSWNDRETKTCHLPLAPEHWGIREQELHRRDTCDVCTLQQRWLGIALIQDVVNINPRQQGLR